MAQLEGDGDFKVFFMVFLKKLRGTQEGLYG